MRGACIALALLAASPAAAQLATPSDELKALKGRAADRVAKRDLLSILEPVDGYPGGNRIAEDSVGIVTKPHGTDYRGLCGRESITLLYAPVTGDRGRAAPVRPYAIQMDHEFQIRRMDLAESGEEWFSTNKVTGDCMRNPGDMERIWFAAPDERTAVQGHYAMQALLARVRAGTLTPADCGKPSSSAKACLYEIEQAADFHGYFSIGVCDAEKGKSCFAIDAGMTVYSIVLRGDGNKIAPEDIETVTIEEYIIVT
jgi:hypothetical protein